MSDVYLSFIFGIIGTVLFHVGKSMQKQGIGTLGILKDRVLNRREGRTIGRTDFFSIAVYVSGITLNNTLALWIMLANMYAPSSYFSSMFGVGLVALMLYSHVFLEEAITPYMYAGMATVVAGTLVLGIERLQLAKPQMHHINITTVAVIVCIFLTVSVCFLVIADRFGSLTVLGLATGFFTGGLASLDPVLKGIGQNYGGASGFLPPAPAGWIFFIASFVFSTVSFVIAQWGFAKNTPAAIQVSTGTSVYICFPIVITGFSLPGYHVTILTVLGMVLVVCGILLMLRLDRRGQGPVGIAEKDPAGAG